MCIQNSNSLTVFSFTPLWWERVKTETDLPGKQSCNWFHWIFVELYVCVCMCEDLWEVFLFIVCFFSVWFCFSDVPFVALNVNVFVWAVLILLVDSDVCLSERAPPLRCSEFKTLRTLTTLIKYQQGSCDSVSSYDRRLTPSCYYHSEGLIASVAGLLSFLLLELLL